MAADVNATAHATVSCTDLGVCTYILTDLTFHADDTFTYTLTDPLGLFDTGPVTITVP